MVRVPAQAARDPSRSRGFSLVELIVVIVITGVIASVVGLFITGPIQGFLDQARRAGLVDAAQLALTRMGRDLRGALPNSVRINGDALELLLTLDGERYRVESPGAADDRLALTGTDTTFNTLAPFDLPVGTTSPVTAMVAIYPLQQDGADPYDATDGVMTASGAVAISTVVNNGQSEGRVTLAAAHRFPFDSPTRRAFLVSGPVTYLCSPPQLLRYDGYAVTAVQAVPPVGGTSIVIAGNVQDCEFQYLPGTAQRNAVVSIAVMLADPKAAEERIRLIRQIHIGNAP
ncbi:MAG: prepilin-type N-terminal cleavage/methylation domain-containing protein [Nevskiaceae bacterium]